MVNKCPYRRRQSEVNILGHPVVICFQISIFEPLKTAAVPQGHQQGRL